MKQVTGSTIGIAAGLDGVLIGHILSQQNQLLDKYGIPAEPVEVITGVIALTLGAGIGYRLLYPESNQ